MFSDEGSHQLRRRDGKVIATQIDPTHLDSENMPKSFAKTRLVGDEAQRLKRTWAGVAGAVPVLTPPVHDRPHDQRIPLCYRTDPTTSI